MKRQCSEWEKITANGAIDKGLIFKIYKQLISSISKNPIKKRRQIDISPKKTYRWPVNT